jgi:hypothetical protein
MREPFDRNRVFLAVRDISVGGKKFAGNEKFDVTLVPTRRLRQMYECRMLKMDESVDAEVTTISDKNLAVSTQPNFKELSNAGLRQWLRNQGVGTSIRSPHARLVEQATAKWLEMKDGVAAANRDSEHSSERLPGKTDDGHASA